LITASGSDTASVEASCNAAIAKKFLTDNFFQGCVAWLIAVSRHPGRIDSKR
jgi:hypothetical protein